jgi:ABC-type multidrug transport system fused ATPase/permease subunit
VRHLAGERRSILGLGVLAVLAAQAESIGLVLIALIADTVSRGGKSVEVSSGPLSVELPVMTAGIVTMTAIVVAAFLVFNHGRLVARVTARLECEDRDKIVGSYAAADWEYQSTQKSSRAQGRLRLMDARSRTFYALLAWIRSAASIAVFVAVAAVMSPLAALIIVAFGVALSLTLLPIRLQTRRISRRTSEVEVTLAEDFGEAIDQQADVQVFGAWPAFTTRFFARSQALQDLRERTAKLMSLLPVVYQNGALALILLVLMAASLARPAGDVGQFLASALLLLRSVQYGQSLQRALQNIAASVPRIEVLQQELAVPAPRVTPGARVLHEIKRVKLDEVGYTYPGAEQPALQNISLVLQPGTIVGLAGPSGSGKSTLAQILLRLRWPTAGRYLVNGRDASEYSVESWSRRVNHLPQEPRLLHGTLRENVTYLDESISQDRVEDALRQVGLQQLVDTLPDGLATQLGPSERNLSGGQVQRLGIARSLVREPRLVVLDEPTSALDVNAERVVADALESLRGRTDMLVVVIAHRPSTLALCDEIVVLQDGQVTGVGKSEELALESDFLAATWATGRSFGSPLRQ